MFVSGTAQVLREPSPRLRTVLLAAIPFRWVATAAVLVTTLACAAQEEPVEYGQRIGNSRAPTLPEFAFETAEQDDGAPTPVPAPDQTGSASDEQSVALGPREIDSLASLMEDSKDTIRIAQWFENRVRVANAIAAYIMVYGYDYAVDLVETGPDEYQADLREGEIDVVLEMPEQRRGGSRGRWPIVDVGTIFESTPEIRVGVNRSLTETAPGVVEFLGKMRPGDQRLAGLAAQVTPGRTGISPTVAAVVFLRNHRAVWEQWLPDPVAERVGIAVSAGKMSLKN